MIITYGWWRVHSLPFYVWMRYQCITARQHDHRDQSIKKYQRFHSDFENYRPLLRPDEDELRPEEPPREDEPRLGDE